MNGVWKGGVWILEDESRAGGRCWGLGEKEWARKSKKNGPITACRDCAIRWRGRKWPPPAREVGTSVVCANQASMYYSDEDCRKMIGQIVNAVVAIMQEATEGTGNSFRQDLWKKFFPADFIESRPPYGIPDFIESRPPYGIPDFIESRPPYGIPTRMLEIIGWTCFELNSIIKFSGVNAKAFNSIFRRSIVTIFHAIFASSKRSTRSSTGSTACRSRTILCRQTEGSDEGSEGNERSNGVHH